MVQIASLSKAQHERNAPLENEQGHPFVMAWMDGTDIYAAAALGHIWLIDGYKDCQLFCCSSFDAGLKPVNTLSDMRKLPVTCPEYDGQPVGCVAMSFSPDRSCLAWVEDCKWTAVSFTPPAAGKSPAQPDAPMFVPKVLHHKARQHLRRPAQ